MITEHRSVGQTLHQKSIDQWDNPHIRTQSQFGIFTSSSVIGSEWISMPIQTPGMSEATQVPIVATAGRVRRNSTRWPRASHHYFPLCKSMCPNTILPRHPTRCGRFLPEHEPTTPPPMRLSASGADIGTYAEAELLLLKNTSGDTIIKYVRKYMSHIFGRENPRLWGGYE